MKFPDLSPNAEPGYSFDSSHPKFTITDTAYLENWLDELLARYDRNRGNIMYRFMTDDELLEINKDFLSHNYYTDIITFPYEDDPLDAELCISIDRIAEHSREMNQAFESELLRVMAHGLLHLCGFGDEDEESKNQMRKLEDLCLDRWNAGSGFYSYSE